MRELSLGEIAAIVAPEGCWIFANMRVTNYGGDWLNLGALAVGGNTLEFFNEATLDNHIDANTLTMSATFAREIGNASLVPFRSDSPVNNYGGSYQPALDLARRWDLWVAVVPIGTVPVNADYREHARGWIDRIDIQGEPAVITVQGRGPEADLIDRRIIWGDTSDVPISQDNPKVYDTGLVGDVIQQILDKELGVGAVTLTVDASVDPTADINGWNQEEEIGLFDLIVQVATLRGMVVRYRYDASDVLTLTLFTPNRSPSTPDWSLDQGAGGYEKLDVGIGIEGVRNYVVVKYVDDNFGPQVVTSPVTPISASIARYKLRTLGIDLSAKTQVTTQAAASGLADAARADLEFPILEQTMEATAYWFAELWDYVQFTANGVHYDEDQFGGVIGLTQRYANASLKTGGQFKANPAGGYRTWLDFGPGAPRTPFTPVVTQVSALFYEATFLLTRTAFVTWTANVNQYTKSVMAELATTDDFAVVLDTQYADVTDGVASGLFTGVTRDQVYYVRVTPYSGPLDSGLPTGVAGLPIIDSTFVQFEVPDKPTFDTLQSDVTAIAAADVLVKTASGSLSAERVVTDTSTVTWDWATAGQAKAQIPSSVALPGSPTTTTQSAGDNSTKIATTAFVATAVGGAGGSQSANTVYAGPTTGSPATPAFRALVAADIPSLDASKITSGVLAVARLGTGTPDGTKFLRDDGTFVTPSAGSVAGRVTLARTVSATPDDTIELGAWNVPSGLHRIAIHWSQTNADGGKMYTFPSHYNGTAGAWQRCYPAESSSADAADLDLEVKVDTGSIAFRLRRIAAGLVSTIATQIDIEYLGGGSTPPTFTPSTTTSTSAITARYAERIRLSGIEQGGASDGQVPRWDDTNKLWTPGGAAPSTSDFLVKTADSGLSAERVVTDTSTIEVDWSTAGQAKFKIVSSAPLPGSPTTTTQSPLDNSTKVATTAYVDAALAAGGYGGSTVLYTIWDPMIPQTSPPSQSDEFTSNTSANYTAIYQSDTGVVVDYNTTAQGALYIESPSSTYHIKAGLKALPAGDFTIHFGGVLHSSGDDSAVGIILADGTTAGAGNQTLYAIGSEGNVPWAFAWSWQQFGNTPTGNTNNKFVMSHGVRYVRLRRVSGVYTASYSADGRVWRSHSTGGSAPSATPTHFGWGFLNYTGNTAMAAIDFLRYYSSGTQMQTGASRTVYG